MGKSLTGLAAAFVGLSLLTGLALAQQKTEPKGGSKPKAEQKAESKTGKEKLGQGEMEIAEDLAKQSGKSVDEILAMRKAGKGWGQIAQDLGVKLGAAVRDGKGEQGKAEKASEKGKGAKQK